MSVTIKDIAKAANVSRGTVDRALNGRNGVKPDVAARIKSIASLLGYRPNVIAKALATHSRPIKLGVILNCLGNPFFDKVINGLNDGIESLSDFGIMMEIRKLRGYDPKQQLDELKTVREAGVDGLILTPVSDIIVRDELNDMIRNGIQVVCCNLDITDVNYQAYVGCDYYCSGQTAGELIGSTIYGEANLAIITSTHSLYIHELRVEGCKSVLMHYPNIHICNYIETSDDEDVAYNEVKNLLMQDKTIDLLYFATGGTGGGLQAIYDYYQGKNLKVYTFDQIPAVIEAVKKGLVIATIDQQPYLQGFNSIRIIFKSIMNKQVPMRKRIITELNVKNRYNITDDL